MKTASILVLTCTMLGCSAAAPGSGPSSDPSSFLQIGDNSYGSNDDGAVVVVMTQSSGKFGGKVSATGSCLVMDNTGHGAIGPSVYFEEDGSITADPYAAPQSTPIGQWNTIDSTSEQVCIFGDCQTCGLSSGTSAGSNCYISCPSPVVLPNVYELSEMIPFVFTCDASGCSTLGGATVNADGTIKYGDFLLGTWTGTHAEAQICFGARCALFHPTL